MPLVVLVDREDRSRSAHWSWKPTSTRSLPTPINLSPGTGAFIDLKARALGLEQGQQIEVQPVMTASPPVGAVALNSVGKINAQVFDTTSGRTRTQQSTLVALPAVQ